jgi:hypothetical protein
LEDVVRPVGEKVKGQTAIGEGSYDITITYSNRFKRRMPLVNQVPNYEGIRIHAGNTHEDTEGCVLVGLGFNHHLLPDTNVSDYKISQSRPAFDALFTLLDDALTAGESVRLVVTHEPVQTFTNPGILGGE